MLALARLYTWRRVLDKIGCAQLDGGTKFIQRKRNKCLSNKVEVFSATLASERAIPNGTDANMSPGRRRHV